MYRYPRRLCQRGEITLTLALIGVFVSLVGIGLGASSLGRSKNVATNAQQLPMKQGAFPYQSILEIRNEKGAVVPWVDGLNWSNNFSPPGAPLNPVKENSTGLARVVWNTGDALGDLKGDLKGGFATINLTYPAKYIPVGTFCISEPASICTNPLIRVSSDYRTISNIEIRKDGWIKYGVTVRDASVQPPAPTAVPNPTTPPPVTGKGDMEVKVVALNYPNKTDHWDRNDIASKKPGSCTRQQSGEERPLYLSNFKLIATCVGGGCTVGEQTEKTVDKNLAHKTFQNLEAGDYTVSIKGIGGRGFSLWSGCEGKTFKVTPYQLTQEAVVILQNEDGLYETESTEKVCKDNGGAPNLIQGIRGVLCFYGEGRGGGGGNGGGGDVPPAPPVPTAVPPVPPTGLQCERGCIYSDQKPGEAPRCWRGACPAEAPDCKDGIENGNHGCVYAGAGTKCNLPKQEVRCSDGTPIGGGGGGQPAPTGRPAPTGIPQPKPTTGDLTVKVNNRKEGLARLAVELEAPGCTSDCKKTIDFGGVKDAQKWVTFSGIARGTQQHIRIRDVQLADASLFEKLKGVVFAQENVIIKVDTGCAIKASDGSEDEKCIVTDVPAEVEMSVHAKGGGNNPPPPPPPPPTPPGDDPGQPSDKWFGKCPVFASGSCSVENLSRFFIGEPLERLEKLSAICFRESNGRPEVVNNTCTNTYQGNYTVGLLQISTRFATDFTPVCATLDASGMCHLTSDIDGCVAPLKIPDNNLRAAAGKYAGSKQYNNGNPFCPWKVGGSWKDKCGFKDAGLYNGCK